MIKRAVPFALPPGISPVSPTVYTQGSTGLFLSLSLPEVSLTCTRATPHIFSPYFTDRGENVIARPYFLSKGAINGDGASVFVLL